MRPITTAIVIVICSLFIVSCETENSKTNLPLNVICLVDFSKSIPENTMSWYLQTIKDDILMKLQTSDRLVILPIDRGSQTAAKELLFADLYEANASIKVEGNNLMEEAAKKKEAFTKYIQTKLLPELDNSFKTFIINRSALSNGTDIIGSFKIATKYFRSDMRNIIVVFSDMQQYGEDFKMTKKGTAKKFLENAKNISIKGIEGAEILILSGEQPDISATQMNETKNFWMEFLGGQNANVVGYSSAELIELNKLTNPE